MRRAQEDINDEVPDVGESVEHVQEVGAELEASNKQLQRLSGNGSILHGGRGGEEEGMRGERRRWVGVGCSPRAFP